MRFYIELINDAYATGASQPLRAYATDECDSCAALTEWAIAGSVCVGWDQVETPSLPPLVLREFQDRTKLLAATVRIQPPAGRTLINLDTIFYTDDPATTIYDIPIAGASVDLQITATGYQWQFGDGAATTTSSAGPTPTRRSPTATPAPRRSPRGWTSPTPAATVSTPWLDIPGTGTVTGTGVVLTVLSAHSELIAGIAGG